MILKFIVCKQGPDIENMIDLGEKTSFNKNPENEMKDSSNGGKNAISTCNYYII